MVIFNLISLLHHHTAGHTNTTEWGGGQSRGWNACIWGGSSSWWFCCQNSCFWNCGQCHVCSLSSLLRELLGRRSEGHSDTIPNKFFFCSYFQVVEENAVNTNILRCPCPPAVSTQLLVSSGRFCMPNRGGLQQLCMSDFSSFSPQTLTAKVIKCYVNGYLICWPYTTTPLKCLC